MNHGSNLPLTPPFEDLKSAFHKNKDKHIGESSNKPVNKSKFESFEKTPNKKEAGYKPETESERGSVPESEPKNNMANIADMTMEEYKRRIRDDTISGLVQLTIPKTASFELKVRILVQLKDILWERSQGCLQAH